LRLSFTEQTDLSLMKSRLLIFSFMDCTWVFCLTTSSQARSFRFSPISSDRSVIVFHFTSRATGYLIFVRFVSSFFFFARECPNIPALFVAKTVFTPLSCLHSFAKHQMTIFTLVYFWALCFVLLICLIFFNNVFIIVDFLVVLGLDKHSTT
jgi:hypothetical protein